MSEPRSESRISFLEKQFLTLGASIEELASDTSEELTTLARDAATMTRILNDLSAKVHQGFQQSHTFIDEHVVDLKATLASKEDIKNMATKDDVSRLEGCFDDQAKKLDQLSTVQAQQDELLREILRRLPENER